MNISDLRHALADLPDDAYANFEVKEVFMQKGQDPLDMSQPCYFKGVEISGKDATIVFTT